MLVVFERIKDDSFLYYLARFAPMLSSFTIIAPLASFSPLGLVTLIEKCTHLSYLHVECKPLTRCDLERTLTLDLRDPKFTVPENMWKRVGGYCLQYFSISVEEAGLEPLFKTMAKSRFPALRNLNLTWRMRERNQVEKDLMNKILKIILPLRNRHARYPNRTLSSTCAKRHHRWSKAESPFPWS